MNRVGTKRFARARCTNRYEREKTAMPGASQDCSPWFQNIEHITRDAEGQILWKGHVIEHFDLAQAENTRSREYVRELARRCVILEQHNVIPSVLTVICTWQEASKL